MLGNRSINLSNLSSEDGIINIQNLNYELEAFNSIQIRPSLNLLNPSQQLKHKILSPRNKNNYQISHENKSSAFFDNLQSRSILQRSHNPHINKLISSSIQKLKKSPSHFQSGKRYDSTSFEQFMQQQADPHNKNIEIQQNSGISINTVSKITRIPYYQSYLQYEPEVYMVPKEKVVEKSYFIENIVDYVPIVRQEVQGIDLIPQEVIKHKLQYHLTETRTVHLPTDQKWLGISFGNQKQQNIKHNSKYQFKKCMKPSLLKHQSKIASKKLINQSSKNHNSTQKSSKQNLSSLKQAVTPLSQQSNIEINSLLIDKKKQKFTAQTKFDLIKSASVDDFDRMINQFTNRGLNRVKSINKNTSKYQQTFHVTSQYFSQQ